MITSNNGRRVFALQIAGLQYRYHSIVPPSSTNLTANIATSIAYEDVQAIVSVGAFTSEIDPSGGVASHSPLSIELSITKDGTASDPGVIFGRVGKRSSGVSQANLEEDITFASLPQTFDIDQDLSALSVPRLMHVGAETFRCNIINTTSLTFDQRAVGGSQYQSHQIGLQGSSVPTVSTAITTFRGRRCKLYVASQDSSGQVSDYVEIINGFIESSPYVENGEVVSLSILPLVCLMDTELADQKKGRTFLLQGKHYFGKRSNIFEFGSVFRSPYHIDLSNAVATTGTTTTIDVDSPIYDLQDIFDVSRPYGTDRGTSLPHPRYPILIGSNNLLTLFPTSITTYVPSAGAPAYPQIVVDHTIAGSSSQADTLSEINSPVYLSARVYVPERGEIKRTVLATDALKDWPDVINDQLSSTITTHTTANGAFSTVSVYSNKVRAVPLSDQRGGLMAHRGAIHLWYSSAWYRTSHNYHYAYWPNDDLGDHRPLPNKRRVFYPLDYWMDGRKPNSAGDSQLVQRIDFPDERNTSAEQPASIALAYFQSNEKVILVEGSLDLPTSAGSDRFGIQVENYDYQRDRMRVFYFEATHQTSVTGGYLIHLSDHRENLNQGHFGDWRGKERTKVSRGLLTLFSSPGEIMLRILESGGGGNNGTYDTLGTGLSIHSDNIDEDSFLQNGTTNITALNRGFNTDDFNPRDFFDSLLKSLGCILIMKRSASGVSKLTLQPIGVENSDMSSATITAGDWLADQPPTWSIYEDIVTQVNLEYGWDNDTNEFTENVVFNNQEAINRYGGETSKVNIELYGLRTIDIGTGTGDAYNFFLPIASRIFNLLSNPMRLWKGAIGTGQSIYLDVGSYVTCTSPHLKGVSDSYGVTNQIGMIKSIHQELMSEGCDLEIVHTGINVVNWNSTLNVLSVPATNQLEVSSNFYSSDDVSFFAVDDVVDFLPHGDEDNSTTGLTIQSIAGTTITFTAAHGISAGTNIGTLEPTTFSSASTDHKKDAYLANASGILGTSTEAQEYS
jgi:hypothetical protein